MKKNAIQAMRLTIPFLLLIGALGPLFLDGQVFAHALTGVVCGAITVGCGLYIARQEGPYRRDGWLLAGMGLALGIWCAVMIPSGYRYQHKFNERSEQIHKIMEQRARDGK